MTSSSPGRARLKRFGSYAAKMRGGGQTPARPELAHVLWSGIGGMVAIAAIAGIASTSNAYLLIPPFGATVVLAFAVYQSPLAQPRNIIGGHLLTTLVGLAFYTGLGADWWVLALASGIAIALMQLTRTVHPPAGANPILIALVDADWWFLLLPMAAGAALLVACALVFNNLVPDRKYPVAWF